MCKQCSYFFDTEEVFKNNVLKEVISPVKKMSQIWRIAENTRPQETFHSDPQGILFVEVIEVIISFQWQLRGLQKHKFMKKKAILPVKNTFGVFPPSTEYGRPKVRVY